MYYVGGTLVAEDMTAREATWILKKVLTPRAETFALHRLLFYVTSSHIKMNPFEVIIEFSLAFIQSQYVVFFV